MRFLIPLFITFISFSLEAIPSDDVLQMLMNGNQRFTKGKRVVRNFADERKETLTNQNPFAVVLCCSDSRTCPEIIFDQGLGALFVVRVAGNVAGSLQMDSIEYAVDILGASLILVMGHSDCGAIKAIIDGEGVKDHLSHIIPFLRSSIENAKKKEKIPLEYASILNVKEVSQTIKKRPVIAKLIQENKLKVVESYYELETGKVRLLAE